MRFLIVAILATALLGCASSSSAAVVPVANVPHGALVFDDEFSGTTLDTTKWTAETGRNNNNVTTLASLVTVTDGAAHIKLAKDSSGAWRGGFAETAPTGNTGRYRFQVGDVIEARVFMPGACVSGATSCGEDIYNWPGLVWTSGWSWPADGELDMAEGLGGDLTINYHGTTDSNGSPKVACCYGNEWHVITAQRTATTYNVYWDGVLQRSIPSHDSGKPQSVIMNMGKSNSRTVHPNDGIVDYVRAWR